MIWWIAGIVVAALVAGGVGMLIGLYIGLPPPPVR
jgi:hypothetical protein